LLMFFENLKDINPTEILFEKLQYNRNTEKYRKSIALARMILLNYSPDVQTGENSIIGILFDMNLLFEKSVFRILKRCEHKFNKVQLKLSCQVSTKLWRSQTIRPDIHGEFRNAQSEKTKRFIIDTKWRTPYSNLPESGELKQIYTYNLHFGALSGILLYPKTNKSHEIESNYHLSEGTKDNFKDHSCSTRYIDLFDDSGKIDYAVGEKFLDSITNHL
jgi:5-methylcytosine-specific restriction enzyme subunit McrC